MGNCVQCGRKLPGLTFGKKICQWCAQHEAAQRGDIAEDARQPVMAAPWVRRRESGITLTQILFGANVAVFLAMVLASGSFASQFSGELRIRFGGNYGPLTLSGDWWRLLTYMFLHGDFWHIAFNMWCLWDLGSLCESLYGRWSFGAIYLITGVAAGVASIGWNPGALSVGASGAIFGIAGALLASFYLGEFSLPSIAIRGTLRSLVFFVVINVLFGFGINIFGGGSVAIDNAAHIGGLVSGMILGALIARLAPQHDAPIRAGVIAVVALAVVGSAYGVQRWRGAPFQIERAWSSLSQNTPERRLTQLQSLTRAHPDSAQAHLALGQELFNQEKYPQAETEFKRAVELQPQRTIARFDLGLVYLNEKRPEDAKAEFTQILAQNANDADAHYGMGLALAAQDQHLPAISEFKSAIQFGPQASGVYYEMGRSYAALKMYDEAITAYTQEKAKSGDDADIELALADAYQAKGMSQEAEGAKKKAAELKGSHS